MAGQGRNDDTDPNKVFPGDASGVTSQDTTGSAARPHSAQGEGNGPVDMTAAIDKAKDMTAGTFRSPTRNWPRKKRTASSGPPGT